MAGNQRIQVHLPDCSLAPLGIALALLITLTGCADPNVGQVSGAIIVDGSPAKTGSISFIPVDGRSTTAGAVIENGRYQATVRVGDKRIEIRVPRVVGEQKIYDTPDSPIQQVMEESLPAKFNDESELIYKVLSGRATKDFELSSE